MVEEMPGTLYGLVACTLLFGVRCNEELLLLAVGVREVTRAYVLCDIEWNSPLGS